MKILILGAGKMGSFFVDLLSFDHETAVYETDARKLRFMYNTLRFTTLEEIAEFRPELVINAVTLNHTIDVFREVMPVLPQDCIISDIASVKTHLKEFYAQSGFRYVSTHPIPCLVPRLPIWANSVMKMPSSSVKATIWVASFSEMSTDV